MSIRRIASAVIILTCVALPARAGFVTYEFIEADSTTVGAILTIASPPAFSNKPWATTNGGDLLSFEITDPLFVATGAYTPTLITTVGSLTGGKLSLGYITGAQGANKAETDISSLAGQSFLSVSYTTGNAGGVNSDFGDWVVVNLITIPEPSSLVLSTMGLLTGLGMWLRGRASRNDWAGRGLLANCWLVNAHETERYYCLWLWPWFAAGIARIAPGTCRGVAFHEENIVHAPLGGRGGESRSGRRRRDLRGDQQQQEARDR